MHGRIIIENDFITSFEYNAYLTQPDGSELNELMDKVMPIMVQHIKEIKEGKFQPQLNYEVFSSFSTLGYT